MPPGPIFPSIAGVQVMVALVPPKPPKTRSAVKKMRDKARSRLKRKEHALVRRGIPFWHKLDHGTGHVRLGIGHRPRQAGA